MNFCLVRQFLEQSGNWGIEWIKARISFSVAFILLANLLAVDGELERFTMRQLAVIKNSLVPNDEDPRAPYIETKAD